MLVLFMTLVVAAVAVFVVSAIKPNRVKFRVGLGKITFLDFEADAGSPVGPVVIPPADQPKELPPGGHHAAGLEPCQRRHAAGDRPGRRGTGPGPPQGRKPSIK